MPLIVKDFSSVKELNQTVFRYLTIEKFRSLLEKQAIWFCNLDKLQDQFEGVPPNRILSRMKAKDTEMKEWFSDEPRREQFDTMTDRRINDGRALTAVNCWHLSESESIRMWREYAGAGGVAIRSTIKALSESMDQAGSEPFPVIGRVRYVDFYTFNGLEIHELHRDFQLNFLKDRSLFQHEEEVRVATLNLWRPKDGGIHWRTLLNVLVHQVVLPPGSSSDFRREIQVLLDTRQFKIPLSESSLSKDVFVRTS